MVSLAAVAASPWGRVSAAARAASGELGANSTPYGHLPAPAPLPDGRVLVTGGSTDCISCASGA